MDDLRRIARRLARGHDTISAVRLVAQELAGGLSPADALAIAYATAIDVGIAPRNDAFAIAAAASSRGDVLAAVGCLAFAAKHRRGTGDAPFRLYAVRAALKCTHHFPPSDQSCIAVLQIALDLVMRLGVGDSAEARAERCLLRGELASRMAESGDAPSRLHAVEELRALHAEHPNDTAVRAAFPRGVLEHNLARALRVAPGDRRANLHEALELFHIALTREDRVTDPDRRALTESEIAQTLLMLSRGEHASRTGDLLQTALDHARRAEALASSARGRASNLEDVSRLRRRIQVALGTHTNDTALLATLRDEMRSADVGDPQVATLARDVARALEQRFPASAYEADAILRGLAERAQRDEFLGPEYVDLVLQCMSYDVASGYVISATRELATVVGHFDCRFIGCVAARVVRDQELHWLRAHPVAALRAEWIAHALYGIHSNLADVDRSAAERRFLGSVIAALAEAQSKDMPDRGSLERAALADRIGASSYRFDAAFFGRATRPDSDENGWRRTLYSYRVELDIEGARLDPAGVLAHVDVPRSPILISDEDGNMVAHDRDPHAGAEAARHALRALWANGVSRGWAHEIDVDWPTAEEIGAWLLAHPGTGLLVATPGITEGPPAVELLWVSEGRVEGKRLDLDGPRIHDSLLRFAVAMSAPPRAVHPELGVISAQELQRLAPQERVRCAPDTFSFEELEAESQTLDEAIRRASAAARRIAEIAADQGVTSLRILSRGAWAWFPWEGVPITDDEHGPTLGEALALVHVPTMSPTTAPPRKERGGSALVVGATKGASSVLNEIAASLGGTPAFEVHAGDSRERLLEVLGRAEHVRFVGHGVHAPLIPETSGIELWDVAPHGAPTSLQSCEARAVDLCGAARFEVWACEAAGELDLRGLERQEDEPASVAAALLVAGARRVIAAPWVQPARVVQAIAGRFSSEPETHSAEDDARRLARAVRHARETFLFGTTDPSASPAENVGEDENTTLGPVASAQRTGGPRVRSNSSWAFVGWRVIARDRDC